MKHVGYSNIVAVLVVVVVVVFVNVSCQPDTTCRESMQVGAVCEFSESYFDETNQIRYRNLWDSITVVGLNHPDSLYANKKGLSKLSLPLRNDVDSTTYLLTYHNSTDTLLIRHTPQQQFVSVECGCTYHHDILSTHYTQHWIDSLSIIETTVTRSGSTNLILMHHIR